MPLSEQITVLLVDDHPVVRDGYRRLLERNPDIRVVGEADNGEQAYALYPKRAPTVVVLDLNLPGMGGMETIRRLVAKYPDVRILVFSMHDSPLLIQRALDAGAAGYLTKSSAADQMVEAIRCVAQGRSYLDHTLSAELMGDHAQNADPLLPLTKREFQVFCKLAEGHSVTEIANTLCISPKTVGVHQTNIMNKLDLKNAAELVRLAIRCGVIQP